MLLGSAALALGVVELALRLNREAFGVRSSDLWELRAYVCNGRGRFQSAAYVGWVFDPTRATVNESGFLGPECARERVPGVPRIACLGGSTTAGNLYQGYAGSYPGSLAQVLAQRLGHPVEVLNFGVSGWTTAESLVNWMLNAEDYRPDLVVIHHAINDVFPRLGPGFRSDYRHYRHPWKEERFSFLQRFLTRWSDLYASILITGSSLDLTEHVSIPSHLLGTELRPETALAFRRNLRGLLWNVRRVGAAPVLLTMPWDPAERRTTFDDVCIAGMEEHNQIARELALTEGCELFDLAPCTDPAARGVRRSRAPLEHGKPAQGRADRRFPARARARALNARAPVPPEGGAPDPGVDGPRGSRSLCARSRVGTRAGR